MFGVAGGLGVPWRELGLVFLSSIIVVFLITGLIRKIAIRGGAMAIPRRRDVHVIPIPRWGGIGIFIGLVAGYVIASNLPALHNGFTFVPDLKVAMVGSCLIVILGIVDDRWGLDAVTKLLGQIVVASIMVVMGLSWTQIYVPFGGINNLVLDPWQAGFFTVLLVVAIINAVNFVDGLDGLAAGVGAIAAVAIMVLSVHLLTEQEGAVSAYPPAIISVVLAGACLGFLPHNFQPARLFMGDSGSMLIGLNLAAASTSASGRTSLSGYGVGDALALLSPLLVVIAAMFIPMLDLIMAVVRRTRAGVSPFTPDKMHLHHRLLRVGHSQRRSVLIIYLWAGWLTTAAVTPLLLPWQVYLPLIIMLALLVAVLTYLPRVQQRWSEQRNSRDRSVKRSHGGGTAAVRDTIGQPTSSPRVKQMNYCTDGSSLREESSDE